MKIICLSIVFELKETDSDSFNKLKTRNKDNLIDIIFRILSISVRSLKNSH